MRPALTAAAVLLFTALAAGAQVREQVTVEVVDVPVYVSVKGQPVRTLKKDDFELFVNGKRQQIDYFDLIEFAAAPAGEAKPAVSTPRVPQQARDLRDRRLFLLIFDLAYTRLGGYRRSQIAAEKMVDAALPEDFFAVATYTLTGAQFVIPFTHDRAVIKRAIKDLSGSRARDALALSITGVERQASDATPTAEIAGADVGEAVAGGGDGLENPLVEIMKYDTAEKTERARDLATVQLEEFTAIASRLSSLEGYKRAILFSEGFSPGLYFDQLGATDPMMERAMREMAASFRAAGAVFDTVDVGVTGIKQVDPTVRSPVSTMAGGSALSNVSGVPGPGSAVFDSFRNEILHMYAERTGGEFIHWTNKISDALIDLSNATSFGYRLGFKPVDARKGDNEIKVKVKNAPADAVITFRRGFSTEHPTPNTADALLLADIIQNDTPQTGTPPAIRFDEPPFIDVVVPAVELAKQFGAINDADVMLYVFDQNGTAIDFREKRLSIPAGADADVVIRQKLTLKPGKYIAKSLLRIGKSIGFTKAVFEVPADAAQTP